MGLVYYVYKDPSVPKADLALLDPALLLGLRAKDTNMRNSFFQIYDNRVAQVLSSDLINLQWCDILTQDAGYRP